MCCDNCCEAFTNWIQQRPTNPLSEQPPPTIPTPSAIDLDVPTLPVQQRPTDLPSEQTPPAVPTLSAIDIDDSILTTQQRPTGPTSEQPAISAAILPAHEEPVIPVHLVNNYHMQVSRKRLKWLDKYAKMGHVIIRNIKKVKQYVTTLLERQLHVMTMLHAPKVGIENMKKVIALSTAVFTVNMGIDEAILFSITSIIPSSTTMNDILLILKLIVFC